MWNLVNKGEIYEQAIQRPEILAFMAHLLGDDVTLSSFTINVIGPGAEASELHLDRRLVEKRTYPSIDVAGSGTRREELLLEDKELALVYRLRKVLADMNVVESMELLKSRLQKVKTNAEFLMTMSLD